MDNNGLGIEHEICANCKKEIPHYNYVMHMAHCARNITLCSICKEPVPKTQFDEHKKTCIISRTKPNTQTTVSRLLDNSQYRQNYNKSLFDDDDDDNNKKINSERKFQKYNRLVDSGYTVKEEETSSSVNGNSVNSNNNYSARTITTATPTGGVKPKQSTTNHLIACKFCELELPKIELDEHENYCGSRTDKCLECGELVMYKYKQIHMDSNHGFLKLRDEPGPRPSWDSTTQRSSSEASIIQPSRHRPPPLRPFTGFDSTLYSFPSTYANNPSSTYYSSPSVVATNGANKEKNESYKEISRRLDCKTEYIRNLLHDSASITVPLRHNGAVPRNHFNHNKGPAPQPPSLPLQRKRNPPTELTIPCEFCDTPIPHNELIQHESDCRPDLARFNPRRRSLDLDDYFIAPQPSSPEVELPCEFCADMIPASQLLRHQATCN